MPHDGSDTEYIYMIDPDIIEGFLNSHMISAVHRDIFSRDKRG